MIIEAIYHKPYSEYAFPIGKNQIVIRIRAKKEDLVRITLFYFEKYDHGKRGSHVMSCKYSDIYYDYFEVELKLEFNRLQYMFCIEDDVRMRWYCANGFYDERPFGGYFAYSCINPGDVFTISEWFLKGVIYQVFPDRFFNYRQITRKDVPEVNLITGKEFFGGDLRGIIQKLSYLKDLGVDIVYLNPMMSASTYHRYDTIDFFKVDSRLGSNGLLKKLVKTCHNLGIKVIFDGVFNHVGDQFFAFLHVKRNGVQSKYKDWFYIYDFPIVTEPEVNYQTFGFFKNMPKLNLQNENVQKYILKVIAYWFSKFDIDGIRLDVADEMDRSLLRRISTYIRGMKKDAVIIGEVWDEASSWLNGDQFDSVLNYPLKNYLNELIAFKGINAWVFSRKMNGYLMTFTRGVSNSLVNIIGTHDTERFKTLCSGDSWRFALALVIQFTMPGVPMIYYGDEVGMDGWGDPDCRKPMIWDESKWDTGIFELYKRLIKFRKEHKALIRGDVRSIETQSHDILAYFREYEDEKIMIVLNTRDYYQQETIQIKNANMLLDLMTGEDVPIINSKLDLNLEMHGWKIMKIMM